MELFGRNLRKRARELSLSDAEVARRAGLNERRYGFYVTGEREPDLATLIRISQVLQTSVDSLLAPIGSNLSDKGNVLEAQLLSAAKALGQDELALLVKVARAFTEHKRSE
jgi:transcriptional regulator with XRE-family HTH domain